MEEEELLVCCFSCYRGIAFQNCIISSIQYLNVDVPVVKEPLPSDSIVGGGGGCRAGRTVAEEWERKVTWILLSPMNDNIYNR